jgi:hypothetical protein
MVLPAPVMPTVWLQALFQSQCLLPIPQNLKILQILAVVAVAVVVFKGVDFTILCLVLSQ